MPRMRGLLCLCTLALLACVASASPLNSTVDYTLTMDPVDADFCDSTKQLSGYFKISGSKSKNYFYWFFESRGAPSTDPLIIWLTGGPGCSSMLALLQENGPCSVNPEDLKLKRNPYSWTERANVMWIDQPVGVGFSYGDVKEYDTSEKEVGDDMFHFLQEFFQAEPEYQKQPFYVFGESYAGHYVPAIAHRIFTGNQQQEGPVHVNLQGFGIGNGLTDPEVQYKYYPDMAYNNTYGVKAVSYPVYLAMKAAITPCVAMINGCQSNKAACLAAQTFCNAALVAPYATSGLNVYDIRSKCEHPPMCYDFTPVEKFLRLESTLKKLHVSPKSSKWESCNMAVHAGFSFDWMKNFQQLVPPMLEAGIRGLVYAGDADFIVNWMGCKAWTLELPWSKHDEFLAAEDKDWLVDGKKAGRIRQAGPFAFQQVYEAGHMVPLDQPKNALAMLKAFTLPGEQENENEPEQEQEKTAAEQDWLDAKAMLKDESVMSIM
jgi:carboxypeptidase C (cathepsin A)